MADRFWSANRRCNSSPNGASRTADLMLDPTQTISSVASAVGYASPNALSNAFKRVRGIRPRQHRSAQRQPATSGSSDSTSPMPRASRGIPP